MLGAACLVVLEAYAVRQADPDLWGHITYGRLWLTEGIVATDPYSYTAGGHPWIGHEIGAEVVSYWAYAWGGSVGLCGLKTAAGMLVALLVWWALPGHVRRCRLGLLVWVAAMHAVSLYLLVRPQLFTYVGTAAAGAILLRDARKPTRAVWLLPPICAAWTNFHGGFVVLLGLVGLYLAGPWSYWLIGRMRRRRRLGLDRAAIRLLWVLPVSAVFTFLNPYGPKIWVCVMRALSNPYTKQVIGEWRAIEWLHPTRQEMVYMILVGGLIVSAVGGIRWSGLLRGAPRQRFDATGLLVCGVTAVLAIESYRHIPLFAIVAAPWLLRWGYRAWRKMAWARPQRARLFGPVVALVVIAPLLPTLGLIVRDPRPRLEHLSPMPVGSVRYIQQHRLSGNIYNPFDWGQYLIFHLYPQCRVSMDGRYDTAYPEEEFAANFEFVLHGRTERAVRPPTDFVLAPTDSPAAASMSRRGDWRSIYHDEVSTLWGRIRPADRGPRYEVAATHVPVDPHFFP